MESYKGVFLFRDFGYNESATGFAFEYAHGRTGEANAGVSADVANNDLFWHGWRAGVHHFFWFLEINCDIFYELLRREDGITCLLEEYRANEPGEVNLSGRWYAELFGCQFIRYYAHHFTENEYALAGQIIEEKRELYSLLDDSSLYYLDLPEIELFTGEETSDIRTNYLDQEEIQEKEDKLAAALLQIQSRDSSLQTETSGTEDGNTANQEKDNESILAETAENQKHQKPMIVVGAIICVVCGGGFVFICRRGKEK